MRSLGTLPSNISLGTVLDSIGENVIIADPDYNILWLNAHAVQLLSHVVPLFGIQSVKDILGINMSRFHRQPDYQRKIMDNLNDVYKTRINIKDVYIADIIITPIRDANSSIIGYIVLLMDVTTKAQEEARKEKALEKLSVPLLHIWDKTLAVPLIGDLDSERVDRLLSKLLSECQRMQIHYVLLDFSGINDLDGEAHTQINRIGDCLHLIGTECIIVGISPKLAYKIVKFESDIPTFSSTELGMHYIFKKERITLCKGQGE